MFTPHLSSILIIRREPPKDFNTEKADRRLSQYFRSTVIQILAKDLLNAAPDKTRKKKAQKRIEDSIETEGRKKSVKSFLKEWNYWREFYLKVGPLTIKTKSQLTQIENAIEFCNKNDYKMLMMIACVHRAYVGYKFNPNFSAITRRGEDLYDKNYELVVADIDRDDYEERASR